MTRIPNEWRYFDETLDIPMPWLTGPCLKWLQRIPLRNKHIFEFGAGDSTTWFKEQGAIVESVDSHPDWAGKSGAFYTEDKEEYLGRIYKFAPFDIVVIDGIHRDECTEHALNRLKPEGYLIIDNYKQFSVQAEWPLTEKLIQDMNVQFFVEVGHSDPWQTIVVTK